MTVPTTLAGDVDDTYDEPYCPHCGSSSDWTECEQCGGEGEYECYEDDPVWYDEDDVESCAQCGGAGGWYWCDICRVID